MGLSSEDWRPGNRKQVADEIQGGDDAKHKKGSVVGVRAGQCHGVHIKTVTIIVCVLGGSDTIVADE